MALDHGAVLVAAHPGPVHLAARDAHDVAGPAAPRLVLDEEPDFSVHDIVDLFGFVLMGFGMVARRAGGNHQAAFIAIRLPDDHGTGSRLAALNALAFRYIRALDV